MSRKQLLALLAAASTLTGCTDLEPGVEVLEAIPVTELSTSGSVALDADDPCASVPDDVVTPAGFDATPVLSDEYGCIWQGSGLALDIGAQPGSMAKEVEEHIAMSAGGSDPLAHLTWLRIDDHYAIERILEFDKTKSCRLSLDVSSPTTIHAVVYRVDPTTDEPIKSDPDTSVREFCPVARKVAKKLLQHLDGHQPGWWESIITPTG